MADTARNYTGEPKGAYRPAEFQIRYGIKHTTFYAERKAGRLITRKIGRATIVAHEDAEAWARSLPIAKPGEATPCP